MALITSKDPIHSTAQKDRIDGILCFFIFFGKLFPVPNSVTSYGTCLVVTCLVSATHVCLVAFLGDNKFITYDMIQVNKLWEIVGNNKKKIIFKIQPMFQKIKKIVMLRTV